MGNRFYQGILFVVLSCGLCGCTTHALWENAAFDGFNEPARPANLRVCKCDGDWLVRYDEVNDNSNRIRRRAYYLKANGSEVREHKRPRFVAGKVGRHCIEARALVSTNGQDFALYDGDTRIGTYELPVYAAPAGRMKQVLLTPGTVLADATIVGGYIAVYIWWPAGAPGLAGR